MLEKRMNPYGLTGVSGLWSVFTDAGIVDGTPEEVKNIRWTRSGSEEQADLYREMFHLSARNIVGKGEFSCRKDTLENTSDRSIRVTRCLSRFELPEGEYEIYTQANNWQNESEGEWHPLVARAGAENCGIRSTESAAPILALWNRQTNRGMVFHVFSSCAWKLSASVEASFGEANTVIVEAGINDRGMDLVLSPGEKLSMPQIVYYSFEDRNDLECSRLHEWFNAVYPRSPRPVIFNTWMMNFDRLEPEFYRRQAELAARMGAEYFVVDAGWFGGEGRWGENIGNWVENRQGAFRGRLREFTDYVRSLGLKFGLWLEVERALPGVPVVKEHPEWFFYNGTDYLTNWGNTEARLYYEKLVKELIRQYGIEFIKFDFNAGLAYDPTGDAFVKWNQGYERFLGSLREAFPGIYLECCASGGLRMDMYHASLFDGCWLSDNHSIFDEVRILKDTMLRLPPCCIEKWPVLRDADGFLDYNDRNPQRKLIACDDATWKNVRGVNPGWLRTFVHGTTLGFSYNLENIHESTRELFGGIIQDYKARREFYRSAVASRLCDTPRITAIQYTGGSGEITIQLFAWRKRQRKVTLYPKVDEKVRYILDGTVLEGRNIRTDGIEISCPDTLDACVVELIPAE